MDDLVPVNASDGAATAPPSLLAPLADPTGGPALTRLRAFTAQPQVRKAMPWLGGLAMAGAGAATWLALSPAPQRTLYSELDDGERASVTAALDKASIAYRIDSETGALTVNADELYRARMLVASDGALARPETGSDMLDKLPMGASRNLEGERMRAAREHDLMLTIAEIDGVEAVRVHLAEAERSVFVRDNTPPTASVMLRLADGRQLSEGQVLAIVNLVAGSVPGLTPDAVRVADQHGRLLSSRPDADSDRLDLQAQMEAKLRDQINQLLLPILGDGNFSTEVQVELDMSQTTSARESYDKQGALRSETQAQSRQGGATGAIGVPGATSNTPPPQTVAQPGAPQGTATTSAVPGSTNGESSATRTYELGREVAVSNTTPGQIKRVSVAVALSAKALKGGKTSVDQIRQLVSAAVGASQQRGDEVAVVSQNFDAKELASVPFYETGWFAMALRYGAALVGVLLVLLLGVRPLIRAISGPRNGGTAADTKDDGGQTAAGASTAGSAPGAIDLELLNRHVTLAQRLVDEKPESAVIALRQMLGANPEAEPA